MALTKNDVERIITTIEKWIVEEERHLDFLNKNAPFVPDLVFMKNAISESTWNLAHFKQRLEEYKAYLNHMNVADDSGISISA
jgi:hypothetical protein